MYNPSKPTRFLVAVEDRLNGDKRQVSVTQNSIIRTQEQAEVHVFTRPGSLGGYHPGMTVTPVDKVKFDKEFEEWGRLHPEQLNKIQIREKMYENDIVAEQALRAQATAGQQ